MEHPESVHMAAQYKHAEDLEKAERYRPFARKRRASFRPAIHRARALLASVMTGFQRMRAKPARSSAQRGSEPNA